MDELLQIQNLKVAFRDKKKRAIVLDGIDLSVKKGEIHGLVGESGSGKTVCALSILKLLPGNAQITGGNVFLEGTDLLPLPSKGMMKFRGKAI